MNFDFKKYGPQCDTEKYFSLWFQDLPLAREDLSEIYISSVFKVIMFDKTIESHESENF